MKKTVKASNHKIIFSGILLIFIIILAILLRFYPIFSGNFLFFIDHARDLLLVKQMAVDHDLMLIGARAGLGGIFHGPLWLYMLIPTFMISNGDPFWTLAPIFLLVTLGIILAGFVLGYKLYTWKVGLYIACLLTVSPWLIHAVPYTTNAQIMPLVMVGYIYFIIKFLRGKEKSFLWVCLLLGVSFQFESAFAILLIPLTIFAYFLTKKKPTVKLLVLSLIIFLIPLSTFILFDLRHDFLMTKSVLSIIHTTSKPLKGYEEYASIAYRLADRISIFGNVLSSFIFSRYAYEIVAAIAMYILGSMVIINNWKRKKLADSTKREIVFLLSIPVFAFLFYVIYPFPLWDHYILPLIISTIVLFAILLHELSNVNLGRVLVSIFFFVILISPINWVLSYYSSPLQRNTVDDGMLSNQREIVEWIYNDAKQEEFGYFVYTPGILTYNMDYMMWWLGKTKYNFLPENKKLPVTYIIFYPTNKGDAGAHKFWLKNTLRTKSQILKKQTFTSGVIVEKRSMVGGEADVDPNYLQNMIFR